MELPTSQRVILSLCDYSGVWSGPYREAGYDVRQVDLANSQDVRLLEYAGPVWGVLAAPPCTVFAASGARWKRSEAAMLEGLSIVDACLRAVMIGKPQWWALENPVGKLTRYLGKPVFTFQPSDFGDTYTKRTCLWGRFVLPVPVFLGENMSVEAVDGSKMHTRVRAQRARSETPGGFAQAFFRCNP